VDENQRKTTPTPLSVVTEPEEELGSGLARITRDRDGKIEFFVAGIYSFDREALIYALEKVKTTVILADCLEEDE
jgi:hypothetical protein